MFQNCSNLTSLDLSGWNTGNVTDMEAMFQGCSSLTELTLPETFDTSNVTNMSFMFNSCMLTELTLPESFDTSRVTDMYRMFFGCSSLERITYGDKFGASTELPELPSGTWYDIATGEQFTREAMNNRAGTYVNDPALLPEGVEPSSMSPMSAEDEGAEADASADAGDGVDGADEASGDAGTGVNDVEGAVAEESDAAVEGAPVGEAALGGASDVAESDGAAGGADASADQVIALAASDVPQISETLPIIGTDEAAAGGDDPSVADGGSPLPYLSDELRFAA